MHNLLCRLCLGITTEDEWKQSNESDIFENMCICLNIEVTRNESLPNKICKECFKKIEEIYEFYILVKENQQILMQHLQNSSLNDYYISITNEIVIKNEGDLKRCKSNNDNTEKKKNMFGDETPKETIIHTVLNTPESENINISSINDNETVKNECIIKEDFKDSYSDSDNDISLSLLKEKNGDTSETKRKKHKTKEKSYKNILEQYNCLTCDHVFETHDGLREHYKTAHTKEVDSINETSFTEQISDGNVMFKCDKCNKVYSKKNMKRHVLYHSNERPYVCKLCARTYKTVSDIMRHGLRAHSGHKLYCTYKCGFSTAYTGALKEHEDRVHKNIYKYTCAQCGKGFQVKTWYEQHQNQHTGSKPYVCDLCGLAFHMDKYLKTHCSTMHPQSLDKKRIVCLHCDVKCDSVNGLTIHLQNEHGIPRCKTKCKRTCLCDYCGKVLNRPEQLQSHRRMHLGEKPYHCSLCNKSFLRKFSLRVHERAHSRTREYVCEPCGTRYSQPSALYRHQRIHHGLPRKRA